MSMSDGWRRTFTALAGSGFLATAVAAWWWLDDKGAESVARDHGLLVVVMFVVAYVVATFVLLPSTAFNLAAGAIFGPAAGLAIALIGALSSAAVTLMARRRPGAVRGGRGADTRWSDLQKRLEDGGLTYILALRLFPIVPYGLVSHAASLSRVKGRDFAIGSAIGTPIGLAPFVLLGASGETALSGGTIVPLFASLSMLAILVLVGAAYRRRSMAMPLAASRSSKPAPTIEHSHSPRARRLVSTNPTTVDLSVVIPAYNEADRLPPTLLETVLFLRERNDNFEILVVDDGSTDGTPYLVKQVAGLCPEVRLVTSPENRGKGCSVRTGVAHSTGTRVLFIDADGATPIREIERLERAMDAGAEIAIASREVEGEDVRRHTQAHRKVMGRVFNAIVSTLLLPGLRDTQCGFKMFTRESADAIFSRQHLSGFGFDVEVLFIGRRLGFQMAEIAVDWADVGGSKVRLVRDSICMLRDTILILVNDLTGRYGSSATDAAGREVSGTVLAPTPRAPK